MEQATKYIEETRGHYIPLVNCTKEEIVLTGDEWRYSNEEFFGKEVIVYKADLDLESVEETQE